MAAGGRRALPALVVLAFLCCLQVTTTVDPLDEDNIGGAPKADGPGIQVTPDDKSGVTERKRWYQSRKGGAGAQGGGGGAAAGSGEHPLQMPSKVQAPGLDPAADPHGGTVASNLAKAREFLRKLRTPSVPPGADAPTLVDPPAPNAQGDGLGASGAREEQPAPAANPLSMKLEAGGEGAGAKGEESAPKANPLALKPKGEGEAAEGRAAEPGIGGQPVAHPAQQAAADQRASLGGAAPATPAAFDPYEAMAEGALDPKAVEEAAARHPVVSEPIARPPAPPPGVTESGQASPQEEAAERAAITAAAEEKAAARLARGGGGTGGGGKEDVADPLSAPIPGGGEIDPYAMMGSPPKAAQASKAEEPKAARPQPQPQPQERAPHTPASSSSSSSSSGGGGFVFDAGEAPAEAATKGAGSNEAPAEAATAGAGSNPLALQEAPAEAATKGAGSNPLALQPERGGAGKPAGDAGAAAAAEEDSAPIPGGGEIDPYEMMAAGSLKREKPAPAPPPHDYAREEVALLRHGRREQERLTHMESERARGAKPTAEVLPPLPLPRKHVPNRSPSPLKPAPAPPSPAGDEAFGFDVVEARARGGGSTEAQRESFAAAKKAAEEAAAKKAEEKRATEEAAAAKEAEATREAAAAAKAAEEAAAAKEAEATREAAAAAKEAEEAAAREAAAAKEGAAAEEAAEAAKGAAEAAAREAAAATGDAAAEEAAEAAAREAAAAAKAEAALAAAAAATASMAAAADAEVLAKDVGGASEAGAPPPPPPPPPSPPLVREPDPLPPKKRAGGGRRGGANLKKDPLTALLASAVAAGVDARSLLGAEGGGHEELVEELEAHAEERTAMEAGAGAVAGGGRVDRMDRIDPYEMMAQGTLDDAAAAAASYAARVQPGGAVPAEKEERVAAPSPPAPVPNPLAMAAAKGGGGGGGVEGGGDDEGSETRHARMLREVAEEAADAEEARDRNREVEAARRRRLLTLSISGDNTKWVGWDNKPERLHDPRIAPETTVARFAGNAKVDRAGGYWTAQRFNKRRSPRTAPLPANFGLGAGEGNGDGPRGGIGQHDRIGIDKASSWPGLLHLAFRCKYGHCPGEFQYRLDAYPSLSAPDVVHAAIQPFVVGVTSYSPNRRGMNYQYRPSYQVASLTRSSTDALVTVVGNHDLAEGDRIYFEGILGTNEDAINCGVREGESNRYQTSGECTNEFVVSGASLGPSNFTTFPAIDTVTYPGLDVSSATVHRARTTTEANRFPPAGERDWSYEENDVVYLFVSFSEAVVVTGSPQVKLNTGNHWEDGAVDTYATFVGGGYGEKKRFWKNNEANPFKRGAEPNSYWQDTYAIESGGCKVHTGASTTAGSCWSTGGGITKATDAIATTNVIHDLRAGDLIIIEGVAGTDAGDLNKQHTVRAISCPSPPCSTGHNQFTFDPALDLSSKVYDASNARVGRVNLGQRCRSSGVAHEDKWGNTYCTFWAEGDLQQGTALVSQKGRAHSAAGATFGLQADPGGVAPTYRREIAYVEERREQYMDNVLAFMYLVKSALYYNQTSDNLQSNPSIEHLTSNLDVTSDTALELNGGTIKRACPSMFQIQSINASSLAAVTVWGRHTLVHGDTVQIAGVTGTDAAQINGRHLVQEIRAFDDTSANRGDWYESWNIDPPYVDTSSSSFRIDVDTTSLSWSTPTDASAHAWRINAADTQAPKCRFSDADLTLPKPGDKMKGTPGYLQSLAHNKKIVVGRPYVVNVTSDSPDGTYGYNDGALGTNTVPDIIDIKVRFSEPVVASCGEDNWGWTAPEQFPGVAYRICEEIFLVVHTRDNATIMEVEHNSTTGTFGTSSFPTGFYYETGYDDPEVLNFRYIPRRNDYTDDLNYVDRNSLEVLGLSSVRRVADNKVAGLRLPPTDQDTGTVDNPASLAGNKIIKVHAIF